MQIRTTPFAAQTADRRVRRSRVSGTALQWLLETQVERGGLEAIALATEDGLTVASVGESAELLAALAPSLARGRTAHGVDAETLEDVTVHAFLVDGVELYLALRGGDATQHAALALLGMQGATRILRS